MRLCCRSILDNPSSFATLLASSLPLAADFYVSFLTTLTFTGLPLSLLLLALRHYWDRLIFGTVHPIRPSYETLYPVYVCVSYSAASFAAAGYCAVSACHDYALELNHERSCALALKLFSWITVSMVAFTYSVMAPYILLPASAYFVVSHAVYKYLFLFAYARPFSGGGRDWSTASKLLSF